MHLRPRVSVLECASPLALWPGLPILPICVRFNVVWDGKVVVLKRC